jgi:hypothetical protein
MVKNITFNYFQILKITMNTKKYNNKTFPKKITNTVENDKIKEICQSIEFDNKNILENTGTLPTPSDEQNEIILNFKAGYNLKIEAVAGSGKTTTLLYLARINSEIFKSKSLILTYSKSLQLEIEKMIDNCKLSELCQIYTYHGYASKMYKKGISNDKILRQYLDTEPLYNPKIPILLLDEVQDMNEDSHKLVNKITYQEQMLTIVGDKLQCINEYIGASSKYLTNYEQYFNTGRPWKELTLRTSYRMTPSIANFVNKNIVNKELIIGGNIKDNDIKPVYYYGGFDFAKSGILGDMIKIFGPDEIVIMKPSVPSVAEIKTFDKKIAGLCPLGELIKRHMGSVKFCVRDKEESLSKEEMYGKILVSSFNSMKGKQKNCVILYSQDESYFRYYDRDWPANEKSLPNILYVATTRAKKCLILIQDHKEEPFRTTNKNIIQSTCHVLNDNGNKEKNKEDRKKDKFFITDVIQHRKTSDILELLNCIKIVIINNEENILKYDHLIGFGMYYENMRSYYGILIPVLAEYKTKGNIRYNENKIMPVPDENNFMIEPLHIVIRYNELILNLNKTYNEWMELIVINQCLSTGYFFYVNQITNYDWVDSLFIEKSVDRILDLIPDNGNFEVGTSINKFNEDKNKYNKHNLCGDIDYLTNDTIFEFKSTSFLSDEHKIQCATYVAVYQLQTGISLTGKLFNSRTLELLEITVENPELFVDTLMKKYL